MQIPKPSEDDKAFFRSIMPEDPGVEVKPMFGNLGAFVNGDLKHPGRAVRRRRDAGCAGG